MQTQPKKTLSDAGAELGVPHANLLAPPPIFSVNQFARRNRAFTAPALRNLIFKAKPRLSSRGVIPGNGLLECGAVVRVGRKVLLDEVRFFDWVRQQDRSRT